MPQIKVKHFKQDPGCCAIAACTCLANFYNPEIEYEYVKNIALKKISKKCMDYGLDGGEIGRLLNILGFRKTTMVSSNTDLIDFKWAGYKKQRLISCLREALKKKKSASEKGTIRSWLKWLEDPNYENDLIIDYNYGSLIRNWIRRKKPLGLSFNWTVFFKFPKDGEKGGEDVFNGDAQEHAVVAYGYDTKGVKICDSHHQNYKYRRAKYRKGYYKISWENLMTVMGTNQELYLPEWYEA